MNIIQIHNSHYINRICAFCRLRGFLAAGVALLLFSLTCHADTALPTVEVNAYKDNITLASHGNPEAARIVGDCYLTGTGVKTDVNQAWKWYARAAGK